MVSIQSKIKNEHTRQIYFSLTNSQVLIQINAYTIVEVKLYDWPNILWNNSPKGQRLEQRFTLCMVILDKRTHVLKKQEKSSAHSLEYQNLKVLGAFDCRTNASNASKALKTTLLS